MEEWTTEKKKFLQMRPFVAWKWIKQEQILPLLAKNIGTHLASQLQIRNLCTIPYFLVLVIDDRD